MAKRIAVLTSGGDAPGMNAAIRAIVRVGIADGFEVFGVRHGLQGLIDNEIFQMGPRDVSNIIQRGGTILHTARSKEFMELAGRQKAADNLRKHKIAGLLAIGGDGTFHGLVELAEVWDGQIIGLPGTIDNDLYGTDFTIGFDTAINTALESIDRLRDTAESHERLFLVEVMGRWAGYIALDVTIAGGAEQVILPEFTIEQCDKIALELKKGRERGKTSGILIVSERGKEGGVYEIAKELEKFGAKGYRVSILGHIQRGGSPTARDRVLATKLGAYAVKLFEKGQSGVMAGEMGGKLVAIPLKDTWTRKNEKPLDEFLLEIIEPLSI